MQRPGLTDQRADRCDALGQLHQRGVLGGRHITPARHPERRELGVLEALIREQLEQLAFLGVGGRETGLDQVNPQLVELVGDAQLLLGREGHPLPLHAVAQGGVV
jgi:hypothetical protein